MARCPAILLKKKYRANTEIVYFSRHVGEDEDSESVLAGTLRGWQLLQRAV